MMIKRILDINTTYNNQFGIYTDVKKKGPLITRINPSAIIRFNSSTTKKTDLQNGGHNIDGKKMEVKVKALQEKIVIATLNNDMKEVYRLQGILVQSFEAKAIAIRRIVTNKGGKTAGIDKIVGTSPQEYWSAIMELSSILENIKEYKAQPVRRVLIPGSKDKRPLGIPTMIDRAVQALYHLGVDPAVEAKSDFNSFGFRKFRSTHDAITAIRSLLDKKHYPHGIVEADISKCFDRISHDFLMKHTPIRHKHVLKQGLEAGIMEEMNFIESTEGTHLRHGGIMSPTLCNIALNDIEDVIKQANPRKKGLSAGVHIIRYADDMIITAKSKEIAIKNKEILASFLVERNLELNENKTVITHIKDGFNFLGFNIKRIPGNPKYNKDTEQETILIITPAKKGVNKLVTNVKKIININRPLEKIISELNPILRGGGEYHRISYHAKPFFIKLDHGIFQKMLKGARMHTGSVRKNVKRFLIKTRSRKWNGGISLTQKLINLGEIPIITMRPLKLDKNPYLTENLLYFNKRREKLIDAKFRATIYKIHKQTCPVCGESLHNGESVELHHIVPRKSGGKYSVENILPLHEICHKQVTHGNLSLERLKFALDTTTLTKVKKIKANKSISPLGFPFGVPLWGYEEREI